MKNFYEKSTELRNWYLNNTSSKAEAECKCIILAELLKLYFLHQDNLPRNSVLKICSMDIYYTNIDYSKLLKEILADLSIKYVYVGSVDYVSKTIEFKLI